MKNKNEKDRKLELKNKDKSTERGVKLHQNDQIKSFTLKEYLLEVSYLLMKSTDDQSDN